MLKINSLQQKIIYIYQHIDVASHEGWLKVGETVKDVEERVRAQNEADNVQAKILWTTEAIRNNGETFSDKEIHRLLVTKGVEREKKHNTETNRDSEWFKIDFEALKQYILDYKNCIVNNVTTGEVVDYVLRAEQQDAVEVTKNYWQQCLKNPHKQPEFLWNAKPRFGKTLTAYEFAKSVEAKRILIITNRPAISDSWFSDYKKFIKPTNDYIFSSSDSIARNNPEIYTRADVLKQNLAAKPTIHFISLQDIKGQGSGDEMSKVYSWKEKNKWLFELKAPWDLLIIDESHEGVDTTKSFTVLTNLNYTFALHLSGTPFKAIQNNKFNTSQIYNWSYTDEQSAKTNWNILDGENPYAALPKLNVFTYQLSRALVLTTEQAKEEGSEYAFDLAEFFRVISDRFVYETEVIKFLNNICDPRFEYSFSKPEYLESLRHTFWLLPGVKQCEQMKKLLQEHPFFKDYNIILAAGDWEKEKDIKTALEGVRNAIGNNPLVTKTITLSCGQLTTGVTVPAWTAVIMLNNCKSPALYMQSAFRSQNPFEFAGQMKTNCYVFDFAPDRILQTIADFADNMRADSNESREEKVKMLLNFLPVIAEDDEGKMKELDANEVLTIPLKLITQEVVNRGFMSNRLFENIAGIFGAPKSVMEILEKIKPEENKRYGDHTKNIPTGKVKIWVDTNKKIHIGEDIVINTTNGLLGDKKFVVVGSEDEKEVQQVLNDVKDGMRREAFPQQTQQIILKELEKKMPAIVAKEPVEKEIDELPLPEPPDNKPTKSEKTEEEKVRDRLRGFTRTIPSFLMAYGNKDTNLANFEQNIPDNTFKELTNITKEEFQQLRDGFEYEEAGEKMRFDGLFNADVFNASIALFLKKKQELANYFKNDAEDIFDYIPPQETNQIFTPKRVVKMIVDSLQEAHPELFTSKETTFCDLYMKSGLFIVEVARRLFENTRSQYPCDRDCIKHILEKQVFGFAPTDILYNICINLIFGFDSNPITNCEIISPAGGGLRGWTKSEITKNNFHNIDTTPYCKQGNLETVTKEKNMKFDVIIGNPPYQEMGGSGGNNDAPIFQHFAKMAKTLGADYISLIIPARWFAAGRENLLSEFRSDMLNSQHIEKMIVYPDCSELFANVEIKGGVCYYLFNINYKGCCDYSLVKNGIIEKEKRQLNRFDILIREPKLSKIVEKVDKQREKEKIETVETIISSDTPFGISSNPKTSKKNPFMVYENYHEVHNILLYHIENQKRKIEYINRKDIKKNKHDIDKDKVFITGTGGSGNDDIVLAQPELAPKNSVCSQSYLYATFKNKLEAENFIKYLKTKFFRILVSAMKITQSAPKRVYRFVPLQDFTEEWTDEKLYKKYGLTRDEIDFIECMIRPME